MADPKNNDLKINQTASVSLTVSSNLTSVESVFPDIFINSSSIHERAFRPPLGDLAHDPLISSSEEHVWLSRLLEGKGLDFWFMDRPIPISLFDLYESTLDESEEAPVTFMPLSKIARTPDHPHQKYAETLLAASATNFRLLAINLTLLRYTIGDTPPDMELTLIERITGDVGGDKSILFPKKIN